jgi:subtilisin
MVDIDFWPCFTVSTPPETPVSDGNRRSALSVMFGLDFVQIQTSPHRQLLLVAVSVTGPLAQTLPTVPFLEESGGRDDAGGELSQPGTGFDVRRTPRRDFANVATGAQLPRSSVPVQPTGVTPQDWLLGDRTGRGVTICLIDSGVDYRHDLVRNSGSSFAVTAQDGQHAVVPVEAQDSVGHGTACASVIGQAAPDAVLDSYRVLGPTSRGNGEVFLAALETAIARGYHIVNLSLSSRNAAYRARFVELAELAAAAGVLLVCSAHNSPVRSYPWSLASVISVGSHDRPDSFEVQLNPQPPVDFYAGGVGVTVAWLDGATRRMSGNSFATPAITANLARIIETFPNLRTWQYRYLLALLATNVRCDHHD